LIDLFNGKKNGFFVEIGAFNGVRYNDSYTLEQHYNWQGILVEPDPEVFKDLRQFRPNAILCNKAIAPSICDEAYFYRGGIYGGLSQYMDMDQIREHSRRKNDIITVSTIRLAELLDSTPEIIDFLCLDVAGAELPILEDYFANFNRKIRTLVIEFNFDYQKLANLRQLLKPLGYECCQLRGWDSCWRNIYLT